jgi:hypothetical protein
MGQVAFASLRRRRYARKKRRIARSYAKGNGPEKLNRIFSVRRLTLRKAMEITRWDFRSMYDFRELLYEFGHANQSIHTN